MKLTIDRREVKEGLIFKTTVYYLDVSLDLSAEEMELLKKHQWDKMPMCEAMFKTGIALELSVGSFAGKSSEWGFKTVEHLAHAESQIIENSKLLKQKLEAGAGFTTGGPREIEL